MTEFAAVHGPLILRLMARLFPLRESLPEGTSLAELRRKYLKWEGINSLEYIAAAAGSVYLLHVALESYGASQTRSDPAAVYTLRSGSQFWYFPASLLSCALAGILVHLLNRIMLPEGGREFRAYYNVNAKFNARGMLAAIGALALVFGGLLSYFAAANEVVLRQNDMMIRRLWSFDTETNAYSEITALKQIQNTQNNRTVFEIDFAHGQPWTTSIEVIQFTPAEMTFLAQRSGKPIQELTAR